MSRNKLFKTTVLILTVLCFGLCGETPTTVQLEKIYDIALASNDIMTFQIEIPTPINNNLNLYISGYSPVNDPYQQPTLKIISNDYTLTCDQDSSVLNSVCFVPSSQVTAGRKFKVQATCPNNCTAKLVAYLNPTVLLDINQQVQISTDSSPLQTTFKIAIPNNYEYTEIQLLLNVKNKVKVTQKVQMYINCGKDQVFPTKDKHNDVRIISWGESQMGSLRKGVEINQNDQIYVMMKMGANTTVTFQSRSVSNGTRYLYLNNLFNDNIESYEKLYLLDLKDIDMRTFTSPIYLQFTLFAGFPTMQVAFDKQFKTKQVSTSTTAKMRFQIPLQTLQSPSFSKTIYVKVSSASPSTYSIYPKYKSDANDDIQMGFAQYIEVKPANIGVLVHQRDEVFQNQHQNKTVEIKIQNQASNDANIKVFACKQLSINKCKLSKASNLQSVPGSYEELTIQQGRQTSLAFYSKNHCISPDSSKPLFYCIFVIAVIPTDKKAVGKYSVTILEEDVIIPLSEAVPQLAYVQKGEYKHFSFYLPQNSMNVNQVFFFVNKLDGAVKIFGANQIQMPSFQNIQSTMKKTGFENITFTNFQIRSGFYYVSVYGYEYSDFIINVIVKRINENGNQPWKKGSPFINPAMQNFQSNIKQIQTELLDSIAQVYNLEKGSSLKLFKFRSAGIGKIALKITSIVGKITTYVTNKFTNVRTLCDYNECELPDAKPYDVYIVEVQGDIRALQTFSIVFKQTKQCYKFPVGTPIYIWLDKNEKECLDYSVNIASPFQISSSLTNIQLINKQIQIVIEFDNSRTYVMTSNSYVFTVEQLNKNCASGNPYNCKIIVRYKSFDKQVYLQTIGQKLDGVITLYDGVVQRVDANLSKQNPQYYRYPLDKDETIQIFITSESYCSFDLYATALNGIQSQLVGKFANSQTNPNNQIWKLSNSPDSPILNVLTINSAKLKNAKNTKNLTAPYLALSIYGTLQNAQQCKYSIEVSQNERTLREGQQQIGYLEANQLINYELYPSPKSLFSIRSLFNNHCFKLLDSDMKQLNDNLFIEEPRTVPLSYYIQGSKFEGCLYQISLQDYADSILTLAEGFPTRIVLNYQETAYFLYKHSTNSTFKIYQFIEAGTSKVYATPISSHSLQNGYKNIADSIRLNSFKYKGQAIDSLQVEAQQNSTDYCFDCYYLIAVKGDPAVQQQIVVVRQETPVTLRDHSLLDSYLDANDKDTFVYYISGLNRFNISIDVVYGAVNVTVKSYQGSVVYNKQFDSSSKNLIQVTKNGNIYIPTQVLDAQNKYRIQVVGLKQTLYHIQIIKYQSVYRIAEGITSKIQMSPRSIANLQFQNDLDRESVQVVFDCQDNHGSAFSPSVYFNPSGRQVDSSNSIIPTSKQVMGSTMKLSFQARRGYYSISIANPLNSMLEFFVSIPRPGLSQLRPEQAAVSQTDSVYEIFTYEGTYAIIQAFTCKGSIKIRGSTDPSEISRGKPSKNQVQLLHSNVGGHFVVTTPANTSGQYFIRTQNKQYEANIKSQATGIQYRLQYRVFKAGEINPYDALDADNFETKISFSRNDEIVNISFSNVKSIQSKVKVRSITYMITMGSSEDDVNNYMFCATFKDDHHYAFTAVADPSQSKFEYSLKKNQIKKLIDITQGVYIGATAMIFLQYENGNKYDDIYFIYEPTRMLPFKTEQLISQFGIFELMVLVSLVIGGAVIIYTLALVLHKLYLGYTSTNELMEQEDQTKNVVMKSSQFEITQQKNQKIQEQSHTQNN